MRVWICIEDVPKLVFVIPPAPNNLDMLIGFHLSCPMGYVKSALLFCTTTETIANFANHGQPWTASHPLDALVDSWSLPSDTVASSVLSNN